MVNLVSFYFQDGIKISTVEKFMDLCKDCEYCLLKEKCSRELLVAEMYENGHIFCDSLGAMLYQINEENK